MNINENPAGNVDFFLTRTPKTFRVVILKYYVSNSRAVIFIYYLDFDVCQKVLKPYNNSDSGTVLTTEGPARGARRTSTSEKCSSSRSLSRLCDVSECHTKLLLSRLDVRVLHPMLALLTTVKSRS